MSIGLFIVWVLSISQFALYTVATMMLMLGVVVTNFGIPKAVITFGSKNVANIELLGRIFICAQRLNVLFYILSIVLIIILSTFLLFGKEWGVSEVVLLITLVVLTCWFQTKVNVNKAILDIHHDDIAQFIGGIAGGVARLSLCGLCVFFPLANAALLVNLTGVVVTSVIFSIKAGRYIKKPETFDKDIEKSILHFVIPLAPGIIYFALQGQISVLLLSVYGQTEFIAQVGALGRLGQFVALFMMVNPFFIQPYFARIERKSHFVTRLGIVVSIFILCSIGLVLTAMFFPSSWLFFLGGNYSELAQELPVAIAGALFGLFGGTLYAVVISTKDTSYQYWGAIVGFGCQATFIAVHGVQTTIDALYLNLIPAIGYSCVQGIILGRISFRWKSI